MKLRAYLIILSVLCTLDTYAHARLDVTRKQLKEVLRRFPLPEECDKFDGTDLHFATLIFDRDIFQLFCQHKNEMFFYAVIAVNGPNPPEKFFTKVTYNSVSKILIYQRPQTTHEEFLHDRRYQLEPKEALFIRNPVTNLTNPSTIVYLNEIAPGPLKHDLDRIWSLLKNHCVNTPWCIKKLIVIPIDGAMIPAEFDYQYQKVYIRETETTRQTKFLINGEENSVHFSTDYSLKTGEFSAPPAWGVVQIRLHHRMPNFVNLRDGKEKINLEDIVFPLRVFGRDLHTIRFEMTNPLPPNTGEAKSLLSHPPTRKQSYTNNGIGGVVVNGEVLMKISRTTKTDQRDKDGFAAMVKIEAPTLAPKKSVYMSKYGFNEVSGLTGSNVLKTAQNYYIKGQFLKKWPEYLLEYVDMRVVRLMLTDSLEEHNGGIKRYEDQECVQMVYFVYQKRMCLETKVDVCERIIELENLEVLRLKRAAGELEAFKTFYDWAYFLRKDFATKDGALEDALSVRLKPFHESYCNDCSSMRYNIDSDDWRIYQRLSPLTASRIAIRKDNRNRPN